LTMLPKLLIIAVCSVIPVLINFSGVLTERPRLI
jgi:hypothetical protein